MDWSALFFMNSMLLGIGLAMDAFTVSLVDGMNLPSAGFSHAVRTAGTFGFFQALMPITGWLLAHTLLERFSILEDIVPWISSGLLAFIGFRMMKDRNGDMAGEASSGSGLFVQGIATSIDALSAGLALSSYGPSMAVTAALIIAAVTFLICLAGVHIGKKCGLCLADKASVVGGIILILLAVENILRRLF